MKHIFLGFLVLFLSFLLAEIHIIESEPQLEHDAALPFKHHLTQEEIDYFSGIEPFHYQPSRTPPTEVLRPVAEFDRSFGVLVRYPLGIPLELIRIISQESIVVTLVGTTNLRNQAINGYTNANVNLTNCRFIVTATDSYWTRDYGPWFSFSPNGDLNLINFNYNRPRPNDNAVNAIYALWDTLAIYNMPLTHCGGNYMTDGINIGASTHIVYTENGNDQTFINQQMEAYLGVSNYYVVQDPNNTYINHIDCWGKFLAPNKVMIRRVPTTHAQFAQIEATAILFGDIVSEWGEPYQVFRVDTPNNEPYTNSLILNDRVFVPLMNHITYDNLALQAYQHAMPGYRIFGVLNNTSNYWESTDALHCRVKELADKRIINITHVPLFSETEFFSRIKINTSIISFTGYDLNLDSLKVYYSINQGEYLSVQLINHPTNIDDFFCYINNISDNDELSYYIKAVDNSNRYAFHPYIGSEDPHKASVIKIIDLEPPFITHTPLTSISIENFPVEISTIVTDNDAVAAVYFDYFFLEEMSTHEMLLTDENTYVLNLYLTDFFDILPEEDFIFYYKIRALDFADPQNLSIIPQAHYFEVQVNVRVPEYDKVEDRDILQYTIYPNPFSLHKDNFLNVNIFDNKSDKITLTLFNIKGQKISQANYFFNQHINKTIQWELNTIKITNGIYFYKIEAGHIVQTGKILFLK